jgi:predicted dehydrogenase
MDKSRRTFIKKTTLGATSLALGLNAVSYGRIIGSNDRINFAVAGLNSRGKALTVAALATENSTVSHICDVDSRVIAEMSASIKTATGKLPKAHHDIRKLLESKDVDALAIATPDHWHAPMAIMGVQAGKDVYVEKPCSHNPGEGELLVEVQKKYGKVIQMGNQQRSGLISIQAMQDIHNGIIGKVYMGKAWYSNSRGSIGVGQPASVPDWLNWDLWQGPSPRISYKDNVVHYNWHWFERWGTGEINNNGTHEIDICRWALKVDYPIKVSSSGGRYHYNDDWEFPDTQVASFEFTGGKMITWEGKSCNAHPYFDRGRGVTIHGTEGTVLLDRNSYLVYDNKGNLIRETNEKDASATMDAVGAGSLDTKHMVNFVDVIRHGADQHSPIEEGHKSNLLCHLGNISQKVGRVLNTDPQNGRILDDTEAMNYWHREYESGWKPVL